MTSEKAGLGEQALNKIAEMALASQLEGVERLKVQVKTDLSKLAHGEVDLIAININGLVMQPHLGVEELRIHINRVIVKPLGALFGKIQLTQPSEGTARIVINEDNLTRAFNSESFHKHLHKMQGEVENKWVAIHLPDGNIAFNSKLIMGKTGEARAFAFTTTPRIGTDGQGIVFQDVHYVEGNAQSHNNLIIEGSKFCSKLSHQFAIVKS